MYLYEKKEKKRFVLNERTPTPRVKRDEKTENRSIARVVQKRNETSTTVLFLSSFFFTFRPPLDLLVGRNYTVRCVYCEEEVMSVAACSRLCIFKTIISIVFLLPFYFPPFSFAPRKKKPIR